MDRETEGDHARVWGAGKGTQAMERQPVPAPLAGGDPDLGEVERFARAIVRVWHAGQRNDAEALRRAGNTYATAFQFLVLRRGCAYGLALGRAAETRALALLVAEATAAAPIVERIAAIHDTVVRDTADTPPGAAGLG